MEWTKHAANHSLESLRCVDISLTIASNTGNLKKHASSVYPACAIFGSHLDCLSDHPNSKFYLDDFNATAPTSASFRRFYF